MSLPDEKDLNEAEPASRPGESARDKFRKLVTPSEWEDEETYLDEFDEPGATRMLDDSLKTIPVRLSDSVQKPSDDSPVSDNHIPGEVNSPALQQPARMEETPSNPDKPKGNPLKPGMIPPAPPVNGDTPTKKKLPTPPPPISLTPTPVLTKPAVDRSGMPLPRRVDQIDMNATRAIPVKQLSSLSEDTPVRKSTEPSSRIPPATPPASPGFIPVRPISDHDPDRTRQMNGAGNGSNGFGKPPKASSDFNWPGCLVKSFIGLLFVVVLIFVGVGSFLVFEYFRIAQGLPPIDDLQAHTSQFETTRILDRNGNTLYEILDPNAGRRTYTKLEKISPYLVAATIATEDRDYYNHPGFDPFAIARAMFQNYTRGEITSGASTITQQLARTLLFTPEERYEQTLQRKTREIVLAAEITRRYSKDTILELYLNENNYGNLAYGVEAAAQTYFNTSASQLDFAQSAFLAGLPQAPAVYDIHTNRETTIGRMKQVLLLLLEMSKLDDCIDVSNSPQPICVTEADVIDAVNQVSGYEFKPVNFEMKYPHWVNYVRTLLEAEYDPQRIYRSGFTVYTTLDPVLQQKAEKIVAKQVEDLADRNVKDGALVAIQPKTGEILAMVGSADFYNEEISGQVNMAVSPRQPGSSIKPLTYVAAFEK